MCDLWIEKYQPTNLNEVIGNKSNIQKINNLINNFKDSEFSNFVISGYHGVGKNTIIKLILKKNNYTMKYLSYKDEKAEDLFNDLINYCNGQHIDNLFKKKTTKFALVINDIEKISLKNEKIRIKDLVQLNNAKKLLPIIFISNIQHNKLLIDILTCSYNIILNKPTHKNLLIFLNEIIAKENINIIDYNVKDKIIDFAQYDIRRLISILYDIKNSFIDVEIIDINCLELYINTSSKKLKDTNLFEATKTLINKYTDINSCLSFYKVDKVLIPLTIHENYSKGLFSNYKDNSNLLESFKNISDSISIGDVIETNIYTDQNWFLHDIHGFYTCCKTSFYLNKNNNPSKKIDYEMKFSSDLNQTSLKNINRKQITNLQKILPNKTMLDIININKIIYNLVLNEKFDIIYSIIKSYNSNIKIIENIIKIDKTIDKISISQKNKKLYNSYIKNDV